MQFGGSGSYGNGGAMRIAPAALCPETDFDRIIEVGKGLRSLCYLCFEKKVFAFFVLVKCFYYQSRTIYHLVKNC